jgi:hypothetical protein
MSETHIVVMATQSIGVSWVLMLRLWEPKHHALNGAPYDEYVSTVRDIRHTRITYTSVQNKNA